MSITASVHVRGRRPFFRYWLPRIVVGLSILNLGVIWCWPGENFELIQRVLSTILTLIAVLFVLGLWVVLFSGYAWKMRLGLVLIPLAVAGAGLWATVQAGLIQDVHFKGDMLPIFIFRWDASQADLDARLEVHRQEQARAQPATKVQLEGQKPTDYPEYRGRHRDGVVIGPPLARDWQAHPPRLLWRQPVGGGYASFAVAGSVAVTIEQRRDQEAVVCYDTATGHEKWVHGYPAIFKENLGGNGPRATPTIAGTEVFTLGATGILNCLELATGRVQWSVNILEGNDNIPWGMSGSPLVYDKVVVVNPGTQREEAAGRALVAYDRATGKTVWSAGSAKAAYGSPMLAVLGGCRQVLIFDAAGLGGYDAANGKELWRYDWQTYQDINVAQPVVLEGDRVFVSSGYTKGCAMLHVQETKGQWSAEPVWAKTPNPAMRCKFSSPVAHQGFLYGLDEGRLVCVDQKTGERKWKEGNFGHGQLLITGDLLVILSEAGKLALVEANPEKYLVLGNIPALAGEKTWNYPALANGKAFIRNHEEMACYDLTNK